jgi:hypothetical protein
MEQLSTVATSRTAGDSAESELLALSASLQKALDELGRAKAALSKSLARQAELSRCLKVARLPHAKVARLEQMDQMAKAMADHQLAKDVESSACFAVSWTRRRAQRRLKVLAKEVWSRIDKAFAKPEGEDTAAAPGTATVEAAPQLPTPASSSSSQRPVSRKAQRKAMRRAEAAPESRAAEDTVIPDGNEATSADKVDRDPRPKPPVNRRTEALGVFYTTFPAHSPGKNKQPRRASAPSYV